MALNRPAPALVIDANVAICAREAGRDNKAKAELKKYGRQGYQLYIPGIIIAECLFVLCNKQQAGTITTAEHDAAVTDFYDLIKTALPPAGGEASLVPRIHAIGKGYGCSRSADSIYIALAEELTKTTPTVLLTFDQGLPKPAAAHAPSVKIRLLK